MGDAALYATIVGLISAFKTGRDVNSISDELEFLEWLTTHKLDQVRSSIEESEKALLTIRTLLKQQSSKLDESLNNIEAAVIEMLNKLPVFPTGASAQYLENSNAYNIKEEIIGLLTKVLDEDWSSDKFEFTTDRKVKITSLINRLFLYLPENMKEEMNIKLDSFVDLKHDSCRTSCGFNYQDREKANVELVRVLDEIVLALKLADSETE